ncbi:nitrate reductase [Saccharospirillum sp. HFRX-1]|uniref:nitrate reductase n=1 Tax=unclassified Saccharospirillum TaxID=2633430 RepID=UPI00371DF292
MTVATTCAYCGVGCGVAVPRSGDRSIQVSGLKSHPANAGRLCVKGTHLGDVLPLRNRLLQPRMDGQLADWDSALTRIARTLAQTPPQRIGFYLSGQLLTEDYYVANKLAKGFLGTANVDTNSRLCMSSAVAAYQRALGEDAVPGCYDDLEAAELVVLIGSNLAWAHPVLFQRLQAARQKDPNKKLVVIDPRQTDTSDAADLHLAIRPGADGRLLNGLLAWLAERDALDTDYIAAHTSGFEETLHKARRHAGTDWDQLAADCGLKRRDLDTFFAWFEACPRTVTAWSMGINQSRSGVDKGQAIINLHLATGRIGKVGATPFSITGQPNAMGGREVGGLANQLASHRGFTTADIDAVQRFWQAPAMATAPGLKAVELFDAAERGDIDVLWIMATNPVSSLPDADRVRRALKRVRTVIVSDVVSETDTLALADIHLPALAWGEKDGTVTNSERCISRQRGFVEAPGEARPDWWALAEVGKRLGYNQAFNYAGPAEIFNEHARLSSFEADPRRQFNLSGLTELTAAQYQELTPIQWPLNDSGQGQTRLFSDGRFATADRRARFHPVAPAEPEPANNKLRLNTGRLRDQWHSMSRTGYAPRLNQHRRDFQVQLNPLDAAARQIKAGDLVRLYSDCGECHAWADITESQPIGQLFAPIHWNRQFAANGGVARLINSLVDPISGQPESKHALVEIEPQSLTSYGYYLGSDLPEELAEGAIWFRTELHQISCWQLVYPKRRVADLTLAVTTRSDLQLTDDDQACFQQIRYTGPLPQRAWLALSDAPISAPDLEWLEGALQQPDSSLPASAWLLGRAGAAAAGRLVCTCFGVRDQDIEAYLAEHPHADLTAVQQALKCSTSCGSCLPEVKRLVAVDSEEPERQLA